MQKAPIENNEDKRLDAVHSLGILDTPSDPKFDAITLEAIQRLKVPISTVSIIDKDREWFKSCQGTPMTEGKRDISFCGHALFAKSVFVVEDTLSDDRFKDNPYVIGTPYIRFYAGVALYDKRSGLPIGVFCVKDSVPRKFSMEETGTLVELASRAEDLINLER